MVKFHGSQQVGIRLLYRNKMCLTENKKISSASGKLGFPKMHFLAMQEIITCVKTKFWQKKVKITMTMTAYAEVPLIVLNFVALFCTSQ